MDPIIPAKFILAFATILISTKGVCQINTGFSIHRATLGFIENKGQIRDQYGHANPQVKFVMAPSTGMKIQLRENGFSYETFTERPKTAAIKFNISQIPGRHTLPDQREIKYHRVDIDLVGANAHPEINAEDQSEVTLNFYTPGTGPNGVQAKIDRKVTYKDVYKDIDLVFVANPSDTANPFEYYFVVRPGADAGQVKLQYKGALSTNLQNGQIYITVNRGTFKERIPSSYLNAPDVSDPKPLTVSYKSYGNNQYGFRVPAYNKSKVLIIDPTPDLIWGTYYGGPDNDFADAIAKDVNNNLFISGATDGPGLATSGAYQTTLDGPTDGLIGKFDNGGGLVWVTYYGGESFDEVEGIKIDQGGNVVATGQTYSRTNITTPGAYQTTDNTVGGVPTTFVLKMDNNGARIWCTYFGGNVAEVAYAVALDSKDNIFITGFTESSTGIATPGAYQTSYAGSLVTHTNNAFLAKFDQNGLLIWGTYYGGTGGELSLGVCVDQQDNVLITGPTASTSGISTTGAWQPAMSIQGPGDAYLAKFDNNGQLIWATYYGGDGTDAGYCVATDQANNIIFAGLTSSTYNIASPGAMQTTRAPSLASGVDYEGFVAKFTADGQRIWGTYYGNGVADIVLCMTTDGQNNIYLGGESGSTSNITTPGSYQPQPQSPSWNAFLSEMNPSGFLQWGTFYGISGAGLTSGIVEMPDGSVVVTGITSSTTNIATCGAFQLNYAGENDIFLGKFGMNVPPASPSITINTANTAPICPNTPISFTATADNGGTSPIYQWLLNGVDVGTNSPDFTVNGLANGDKVSCFLTSNSNSACIKTDTASSNLITVSIVTPSVPTINISASADTICLGTTVSFTATANTISANPGFQWTVDGATTGTNGPTFTSGSLNNGDLISCSVTDNVCNTSNAGYSNTIRMIVNNILTPSVSIDASGDAICAGTLVNFTAIPSDAGNNLNYQWTVNGAPAGSDSPMFKLNTPQEGDIISCTITPGNEVCWNATEATSNTINITVYPIPEIDFSTADTSILAGASIQLNPVTTGNITSYQWTPAIGLSNPSIQDPLATPDTSTTYYLTVTSANNCVANGKIRIDVLRNLHLPNAFTPDAAGKNNIFRIPPNTSITLKIFSIYNRWGALVFSTGDAAIGWDGTFNGNPCEPGAYVYFILASDNNGPINVKGTVILIR